MDESKQAELFRALGVESRLRIIDLLREKGPLGVNELAETLGITSSAVSQHLKVLRYAGLVRSERKGYWLPYEIDHTAMAQCKDLITQVCNCGCKGTCRGQSTSGKDAREELALLKIREREIQGELQELQTRIKGIEEQ
jgi:ArsR family transcriptional regulator, arsenate/arsenite/antimonite-responsive transcriptional repressor